MRSVADLVKELTALHEEEARAASRTQLRSLRKLQRYAVNRYVKANPNALRSIRGFTPQREFWGCQPEVSAVECGNVWSLNTERMLALLRHYATKES